ncbi:putative Dresden prostate carcinoma protein 2 [Carlito syrichta]|uniref:Dresden prostate carcinoma protein 2 n=1 Tax=Carlito syrichta TaxID=1868482 RepID=A0A3Q0DK59_CARSF|nr:putative Dresden prostate carcinoma protein 2 [Carlito syrichta]
MQGNTKNCLRFVFILCRLKGMLKEIKPSPREDLQGCLLNLLLQSQSPSLRRPQLRRERRYPKGKREKLMLARRGITLQKMEMPKQTRHRKLKVLEMPSEVCAFLITVYFW